MKDKEALEIIQQKISDYRTKLEAITLCTTDLDPVMLDGETNTGYYCQLMIDPKTAANIMLKHDYPIYATLGEDAPDEMWRELADEYGLSSVSSVDL